MSIVFGSSPFEARKECARGHEDSHPGVAKSAEHVCGGEGGHGVHSDKGTPTVSMIFCSW